MKWLLLALAVAAPGSAFAASCSEGCGAKLSRCSSACGTEPKCSRRCNEQFDSCSDTCLKTEKPKAQALPSKCPGKNGKLVPCADYYQKTSPEDLNKVPPMPEKPK